jgi:hypothetical protein
MGCMAIRKTQGFTELWCDDPSDVLGDWIEAKYGNVDLDNPKIGKGILEKILKNKSVFMQGYNKVKKNYHKEGEPKRDMTLYEYMFHLHFVLRLGNTVNLDTVPLPPYLHRVIGKPGKFLMYGGSTNSSADRAVFSFHPPKEQEQKSDIKPKTKKFNPYDGLI